MLMKCPECGKEISDKAQMCPHCGCPASEFKREEASKDYKMVCSYCGSESIDDEGYCNECGIKIDIQENNIANHIEGLAREYILHGNKSKLIIDNNRAEILLHGKTMFDAKVSELIIEKVHNPNNGFAGGITLGIPLDNCKTASIYIQFVKTDDYNEAIKILGGSGSILEINAKENREEREHTFNGIYRYGLFGGKTEVYCPRCHSENCSYYQEQKIIPGKTKTKYTANLNPLKPFTLVNKKEKVIKREKTVTESKIMCNDCGWIFS